MSKRVENERSKSRHLDKNDLKNTKRDAFFLKMQSIFKSSDVRRPLRQLYTKYQVKRNGFQFFFERDLNINALKYPNTTAAVTPAEAAASPPVNAPKRPCFAPLIAPFASR